MNLLARLLALCNYELSLVHSSKNLLERLLQKNALLRWEENNVI